ncbi:MAG: DUF1731 domain-containing protein [Vicingaceae bacterium]
MDNGKTALIVGGSGLIGSALSDVLTSMGITVRILTTNIKRAESDKLSFYWNIPESYIDPKAFEGLDFAVNLAGASVAGGLWTKSRKNTLIQSRVEGTNLLFEEMRRSGINIQTYFGASAVGYYGGERGNELPDETSDPGNGFLADLCVEWEKSHEQFKAISGTLVTGRISNVLDSKGGFMTPFKRISALNIGLFFSGQKQGVSWIHIDDLAQAIAHLVVSQSDGVYNLCAGNDDWFKVQKAIYKSFGVNRFRIIIPGFILKLVMGQMASLLLNHSSASFEKLRQSESRPRHQELEEALDNL